MSGILRVLGVASVVACMIVAFTVKVPRANGLTGPPYGGMLALFVLGIVLFNLGGVLNKRVG
jgi:hypothetical protein